MQYNINETVLKNKLRIFHIDAHSNDISIIVSIKAGPLYEKESILGIAHLIEHMLFKGTKKRLSRDTIYNEINLLGDQFTCHTEKDNIILGFRVILEDFDYTLDLISDILLNSRMDRREIEKEKKIVLDEIRNRIDDNYIYLWDSFIEKLYKGSKFARPEIGYVNTVKSLTADQVVNFYKNVFNPSNMTIFVVGKEDFNVVVEKIKHYFKKEEGRYLTIPNIKIPKNSKKIIRIKRGIENIHLMIGRILPNKDSYAIEILSNVLARVVSDKILNEEPISYTRWVYYYRNRFSGALIAYATFDPSNYKRAKELILNVFSDFSKGNIPDEYIKDSIISKKKSHILKHATTFDIAKTALEFWSNGSIYDINFYIKKLEKLTIKQIKLCAKKNIKLNDMTEISLGNLATDLAGV